MALGDETHEREEGMSGGRKQCTYMYTYLDVQCTGILL